MKCPKLWCVFLCFVPLMQMLQELISVSKSFQTFFPLSLTLSYPTVCIYSILYVCVDDFCLVNSIAWGPTGFLFCVCVRLIQSTRKTQKKKEREGNERHKSCQGVLGALGPSVVKQFISIPPLLPISFRCTHLVSFLGSTTLSGFRRNNNHV